MRRVLPSTPFDLIDLLFYLQGFKVVEFRLMGLKLGMELILAGFFLPAISIVVNSSPVATHCFVPFEQHNSSTLVASR